MIMIFYFLLMLLSVAFFTLLERKLLGLIQFRKGPSKVGVWGILQPFADAIKLFSKFSFSPMKSNSFLYMIGPIYFIIISLIFFLLKPFMAGLTFCYSMLILLFFYSIGVYTTMLSGWSSNSKYALIGSMRSITQSLSYEVSIGLIILYFSMSFSSISLTFSNQDMKLFFLNILLIMFLFFNMLIESNRTPFDLSECESELVSGFNVEYGGVEFSFIFLGENLMLIFNSLLLSVLVFYSSSLLFNMVWMTWIILFVVIRGSFPRFRLDEMVKLCWFFFIPSVIIMLLIEVIFL